MSRFLSTKHFGITPYEPGEQPGEKAYIKLNTNESPYPPSPQVLEAVAEEIGRLQLYPDPAYTRLRESLAAPFGLQAENVIAGNGSDEILHFAFLAFADEEKSLAFPRITYGFYPVFAGLYRLPYVQIPLRKDFGLEAKDYIGLGKTIVIANPNAPTGLALSLKEIEQILLSNPANVVIVDEAYVDFGTQSAACLIPRYDNLLVVQTFSKSRSLAGARLGFGLGHKQLIEDLNRIRCSVNPYNLSRMSVAAALAALRDQDYHARNCREIIQTRTYCAEVLAQMHFHLTKSQANFLFARSPQIGGEQLYSRLKQRGILVRHFAQAEISDFVRISVGTREQMQVFLHTVQDILEGGKE